MRSCIANAEQLNAVRDARRAEQAARAAAGCKTIRLCAGAGCIASGSMALKSALERELAKCGLSETVSIVGTGCLGPCSAGPVIVVDDVFYERLKPQDAAELVSEHLLRGRPLARLTHKRLDGRSVPNANDIDFFKRQTKIVLRNCGVIDPTQIEDYIARDGYQALARTLAGKDGEGVIATLKTAGLRGRGGAGFPTWLKWKITRDQPGAAKHVVCNADEGDPGAFMDRSVLEGDPHSVIEGMMIAAWTIGSESGYIYVRAEYPLAVERLEIALEQARECGLLGDNILGSGFRLSLEIRKGSGAFVCGEETALMTSIEGCRGEPRPRPPFPAQKGLWGKPTLLNNVETYANVPAILINGGPWYAAYGTAKSKGTKVFALAGRVKNTGLIEVPMGITLRDIIFKLGGGIPDGRKFKAVQSGGPSGGCVPEQFLDIPVDYDSLASVGSIMGSGGMIVMDETSCMVDVAKFFMDFCMTESCGKCVPCRVGTTQMHNVLERISEGKAGKKDLELLQRLTGMVKAASLCGLGQTAPNPTLTTLRYFMDEYRAHIEEGICPAGICNPVKVEEEAEVGI